MDHESMTMFTKMLFKSPPIRPVDLVHPGNPEAEVNEGDVEGDGGGDEGAHVGVLHLQKVGGGQN